MISLWWLALPLLALPLWWHRERRRRVVEQPLASARFLPLASPLQLRVWRWRDRLLLVLRCLLLVGVIAWLADMVLPWRGDTVLIAPGTDAAWAEREIKQAGFEQAGRLALPAGDAFAWLARREMEWRSDARLLVLGDVPMPALLPRSRHRVEVRSQSLPAATSEVRVAVVSKRAARWKALFGAIDGPRRYVVSDAPDARSELIVWDLAEAPPARLRAALWWVTDSSAFPELKHAPQVDGLRYADSPRGRLWTSAAWPPADAAAARSLFEQWQRLHYAPLPYTLAPQTISASPGAPQGRSQGSLHYTLTLILIALFALERMMTHARRR